MFFREHKGSLAASIATTVEIGNSMSSLLAHVNKCIERDGLDLLPLIKPEHLHVSFYCRENRKEAKDFYCQDTYIVSAHGWGVLGFCTELPVV